MRKEISACERLDETVFASGEVRREIDIARDGGLDSVKLAGELGGGGLGHARRGERDAFQQRASRFKGDVLDRRVRGHGCSRVVVQGAVHAPEGLPLVEDDVGIGEEKELRFAG